MSEVITLELPSELARKARAMAASTNRRFEDAVVQWIERAVAEPDIEELSDAEVLGLSQGQWPEPMQNELSDLLAGNREGTLSDTEHQRLEELMSKYQDDLLRKAQALQEAVARGLRPRLDAHAP